MIGQNKFRLIRPKQYNCGLYSSPYNRNSDYSPFRNNVRNTGSSNLSPMRNNNRDRSRTPTQCKQLTKTLKSPQCQYKLLTCQPQSVQYTYQHKNYTNLFGNLVSKKKNSSKKNNMDQVTQLITGFSDYDSHNRQFKQQNQKIKNQSKENKNASVTSFTSIIKNIKTIESIQHQTNQAQNIKSPISPTQNKPQLYLSFGLNSQFQKINQDQFEINNVKKIQQNEINILKQSNYDDINILLNKIAQQPNGSESKKFKQSVKISMQFVNTDLNMNPYL